MFIKNKKLIIETFYDKRLLNLKFRKVKVLLKKCGKDSTLTAKVEKNLFI